MSNVQVRLNDAVDLFEADSALVNTYVHGSNTTTLETDSGTVSSIAKLQKDVEDTVASEIAAVTQAKDDAETARDEAVAASGGVYVSENDTTSASLSSKLTASTALSLNVLNGTGNEQFQISMNFASQAEAQAGTATTKPMNAKNVADAIAALSSGGIWEPITTVDMDGTFDEIDITSLMAGYTALKATFINMTADGLSMIYGRVSTDGGSTYLDTSGDYWRAFHSINSSSTSQNDGLENRDSLNLMNNNTDELTESASGTIIISGLENGFNCMCKSQFIMKDALSKLYSVNGAVMVNDTSLVNGFKFYNVYAVNWATGGKFILEGIPA